MSTADRRDNMPLEVSNMIVKSLPFNEFLRLRRSTAEDSEKSADHNDEKSYHDWYVQCSNITSYNSVLVCSSFRLRVASTISDLCWSE
ncbi:hypothetical protein MRB53_041503 [Persea americana]|nr:hypothetical protein MRB53_041503 [Persea americana]